MSATETPFAQLVRKIKAAEGRGDYIEAYDLATLGPEQQDAESNLHMAYLAARQLVYSGALNAGEALYEKYRLGQQAVADPNLRIDIAALPGRIAKDRALASPPEQRKARFAAAADIYAGIQVPANAYYTAINTATLYLMAGMPERARHYADRVLQVVGDARPEDDYWTCATRAEASLILGDVAKAEGAIDAAARQRGSNYREAATTYRQLALICEAAGLDRSVVDPLRPPGVLHYSGPLLTADRNLAGGDQERLAEQLARYLAQHGFGFAFGSLGPGGEILCAEACLRAGIELHVVLPFAREEFVETIVEPCGAHWLGRFRECLAKAAGCVLATADSYQDDTALFAYADALGMGTAILRARRLETGASHLTFRAGDWQPDPAGYAANLAQWRAHGLVDDQLGLSPSGKGTSSSPPRALHRAAALPPRHLRAVLFGDVHGFSKVPDYLIPAFQQHVMGTIAGVLREYDSHVLYRNSWGDAIYVVVDTPIAAAACCLDIQDALRDARLTQYGLSPEVVLRLAAHFGPVYAGRDAIRDEPTFFGAHTTLAARMEPVALGGEVYITEAMAAAVELANEPRLRADYVGKKTLPKDYGSARMYSLRRVADPPAASP